MPKVFFGLHMSEGVAEYSEPGGDNYRILVLNDAITSMNKTYSGKPVYVRHVDEVNMDKLQEEADGYVVRSFFNKADGKHWVEFIAVSDAAQEKIREGWKLSNAYKPNADRMGGKWHNVDYKKEILSGEFEHLAIVPDPRYAESIILTAEEFREYNNKKEDELRRLQNSKGDSQMFKFFKKTTVENSLDIENTMVSIKNSKDMTIKEILNSYEAMLEAKKNEEEEKKKESEKPVMANGDHRVMIDEGEEMTVNELVEKYKEMKGSKEEPKEEEKKNEDEDKDKEKKENDSEEKDKEKEEEKKKNSLGKSKKNLENSLAAHLDTPQESEVVDTSMDQVARGKARYGSN